jgi:hypothetical protein
MWDLIHKICSPQLEGDGGHEEGSWNERPYYRNSSHLQSEKVFQGRESHGTISTTR